MSNPGTKSSVITDRQVGSFAVTDTLAVTDNLPTNLTGERV
ncbi:MAG: hypothetical protein AAF974_04805 [Cyanobacteria bacterium P01_E01_bin.34]